MIKKDISNKVAIATTTFNSLKTKSDITRAELAKSTVKKAVSLGYEIIVVDGGSPKEFVNELKELGATILDEKYKHLIEIELLDYKTSLTKKGLETLVK